ncbi:hypothetical protein N7489_004650 [Penicillium chrysogenum]|uniref:uncharacterized protein n=1 Tax=Penicillium chrysogenum TaxID=5076 RepID=UPI0024DF0D51|nr:uncharacterized protein N7489_004650 [Penicillium chrysogenum]KAJ5244554.1 hypothetical protein N7489_004650 [Penicillium chrysogenum]
MADRKDRGFASQRGTLDPQYDEEIQGPIKPGSNDTREEIIQDDKVSDRKDRAFANQHGTLDPQYDEEIQGPIKPGSNESAPTS